MDGMMSAGGRGELTARELAVLIQNPDKFAAMLAEMKAEQERLDTKIALAGPAADIVRLRAEAVKTAADAKTAAEALLTKANATAATIQAEAVRQRDAAATLLSDARESAATVTQQAADALAAANAQAAITAKQAQDRAAALDKRDKALELREDAADLAKLQAAETKASAEALTARLKAAMGG